MSYIPGTPATPGKKISAATTNATLVKNSAGVLLYLNGTNTNASPRFVKWYDKASAPTVGTDVPIHTFMLPGNTSGAGIVIQLSPNGCNFATGLAYAITAGVADSDTTAVGALEVVINFGYL